MSQRITERPMTKEAREAFLQDTSDAFVDKLGLGLWERAEANLLARTDTINDQVIFEMGLRLGWKAALRAAMNDDLPEPGKGQG